MFVYKIFTPDEWAGFQRNGHFAGSASDLRDGFIHLSSAAQLDGTARKHFALNPAIHLGAILEARIAAQLRWEPSRGGALFPHFYGKLSLPMIEAAWTVSCRPDGSWDWPDGLVP